MIIIYFIIGFIQDVAGIYEFKFTQHNKAFLASAIQLFSGFAGWVVFAYIITAPGVINSNWNDAKTWAIVEILFYELGGALGSYLTIKYYKR